MIKRPPPPFEHHDPTQYGIALAVGVAVLALTLALAVLNP